MREFIPFALPLIGEDEISEVENVLRSGWLTTGVQVERFESDFSEFIGSHYSLAVNSATSGLHLALEALGIGVNDKVVTSPYTFTATAEVIRYLDADPIFVDINPKTFNIDPSNLDVLVDPSIRAVIPVHFAGQACDMDAIIKIAKEKKWKVLEDAAHALPATYNSKMIGTLGDLTVFSFYVTKTLATGEGGMVVTNNSKYAERVRTMRLHGINRNVFDRYRSDKPSWYYEVVAPGYKYNMTDIAAAIGIHQLKKAIDFQRRRKWIAERYDEAFEDLPIRTPFVERNDDMHAWHLYVIQLELESINVTRDRFIELMAEEGVGTSVHFIPLHIQPYWRERYGFVPDDFPVAYDVYKRAVSLPIYPKMTDKQVNYVISTVRKILGS